MRQRRQVAARLDARSDQREDSGVRPGEQPRRDCGYRSRAGLGDVAPVDDRAQRAGRRIEQDDRRQVRRQPARGVALVDRDQLGPHRVPPGHRGRHHAEEGFRLPDLQHRPQRLIRGSRRELDQRRLHRLDQVGHRQDGADVGFRQQQRHAFSHSLPTFEPPNASNLRTFEPSNLRTFEPFPYHVP